MSERSQVFKKNIWHARKKHNKFYAVLKRYLQYLTSKNKILKNVEMSGRDIGLENCREQKHSSLPPTPIMLPLRLHHVLTRSPAGVEATLYGSPAGGRDECVSSRNLDPFLDQID